MFRPGTFLVCWVGLTRAGEAGVVLNVREVVGVGDEGVVQAGVARKIPERRLV
jgi:hypothetical protein